MARRSLQILLVSGTFVLVWSIFRTPSSVDRNETKPVESASLAVKPAPANPQETEPSSRVSQYERNYASSVATKESSRGSRKLKMNLQEPPDLETERGRVDEWLDGFRTGKTLQSETASVEWLALRAHSKDQYSESMGPEVGRVMNYVLTAQAAGEVDQFSSSLGSPVVVKQSNGFVGVVTGTFVVKLKDIATVDDVMNRHQLRTNIVDRDINVAYARPSQDVSLSSLLDSLKADGAVESAELEIVYAQKGRR